LSANIVGAEGLESAADHRETPRNAANGREAPPALASVGDVSRHHGDPDDALRLAIHAAVDAGLYERAATLLEVLRGTPAASSVIDLAKRR
jgi:hypothetical protein